MHWPGADYPSRFLLGALVLFYGITILRSWQFRSSGIAFQQPAASTSIIDRVADWLNRIVPTLRTYEIVAFAWPMKIHLFPPVLRAPLLESSALRLVGLALWFMALVIYVWGQLSMGQNWRIGTNTDARLVTNSAFAWSRHPIYLAFGLMAIGTFCIFPNGGFLFLALASLILLRHQAQREELALRRIFGAQYADYCRRTRRWIGHQRQN